MNDLEKNQAVSMKDLLQTQVTAIETEISVDQMRVSLEETRTQIVSAEAEKTAFIREWER